MPLSDPWHGPSKPGFFQGLTTVGDDPMDYVVYGPLKPVAQFLASGTAKAEGLYGSMVRGLAEGGGDIETSPDDLSAQIQRDARERVRASTPDPATTGAAARIIHGVGEGAFLATLGTAVGGPVGAALTTGGAEGNARLDELLEQGVDPKTALASAGLTAATSGIGVILPGGVGNSLLTRLATGAAGNTVFGAANRYADHAILEAGGYHEMADQQKALDGLQMLTDMILGTAFGGLAHLHAPAEAAKIPERVVTTPEAVNAALAENLALADRRESPGVPTNPAASNAHQAAMEKALSDLFAGEPVDVRDTGIDRAEFLGRESEVPSEALSVVMLNLKEHGFLDEVGAVADLEAALAGRRGETAPQERPAEPVRNTKTPDSRQDSVLQYLAKHREGISSVEAEAQGIDPADMKSPAAFVGIKRSFRKNGMSFDAAAEMLAEAGYPVLDEKGRYDPNKLLEVLDDELRGKQHFSDRNQNREAQLAALRDHWPTEDEVKAVDLPASHEENVALVAKAAEIDEGRVESLATKHVDDDAAFMQGIREIVDADRRSKASASSEGGQRAPGGDLFGEDTSARQAVADETRRRDSARNGTSDVSLETGRPDDLFSQATRQIDVADALAERPNLSVPDADGKTVSAREAIADSEAEATRAQELAKGAEVAANCFLRNGE